MDEDLWAVPWPYGSPAAIEAGATVTAPLFAGFSSTLVGLVLTTQGSLRWPEAALSLLVGSTVVFLMGVQCGVWTRSYAVTPAEIVDWWPDVPKGKLRNIQRLHRRGYQIWRIRFHRCYRVGILLLLLGLATALVPPGDLTTGREVAIAVALAGFVGECCWIAANWILDTSLPWAIGDTPDVPPTTGPAPRRSAVLHTLARLLIPLVRIQPVPPLPEPDPPPGQ